MFLTILGAAGCAKEVEWLLSDISSSSKQEISIDCFVDKHCNAKEFLGRPLIKEEQFFAEIVDTRIRQIVLAIADPSIRYKIANNLQANYKNFQFPSFMHPHHNVDLREGRFKHGIGNIFCFGAAVMPDTQIGNFLYQSIHTCIGHDCMIGDAVSLFPGAKISGNVRVGNRVLFGAGSSVKERIQICDDVIIGAGAVVVKNITEPGVYAGVPAIKIK